MGAQQWSEPEVRAVVEPLRTTPGAVLLALQAIQTEFGYIDPQALPIVADVFNVSRADVYGVATFYDDLRSTPPPAATIALCTAEACQASGSRDLVAHAESTLCAIGAEADGIGLKSVFCLGNCALGPAMLVDGRLVGRVDAQKFDRTVATLRSEVAAR